jgi:hypothetical protein
VEFTTSAVVICVAETSAGGCLSSALIFFGCGFLEAAGFMLLEKSKNLFTCKTVLGLWQSRLKT